MKVSSSLRNQNFTRERSKRHQIYSIIRSGPAVASLRVWMPLNSNIIVKAKVKTWNPCAAILETCIELIVVTIITSVWLLVNNRINKGAFLQRGMLRKLPIFRDKSGIEAARKRSLNLLDCNYWTLRQQTNPFSIVCSQLDSDLLYFVKIQTQSSMLAKKMKIRRLRRTRLSQ